MRIVFLVSGGGGTLIFISEMIRLLKLPIKIVAVIGDRDCNALNYAQENSIFSDIIRYNRENNIDLKNKLLEIDPDIIVTNFHKVIDAEIVNLFQPKLINLHYSLLPSFGGLIGMKTVEAAKKRNSKLIGTTTHLVDEIVDNGKILAQSCISVDWEKDNQIEDLIFKSGCLCLLNTLLLSYGIPEKGVYSITLNDKDIIFSPSLSFDTSKLNDEFWNKIKQLA
ncbi:hypothetical protein I6H88_11155 [Elizabethkingia bruuniana]|uniref:phosphoribosylglycinamide formyltransferase 1 n=1 Tax=Elizabethkingia bruuniana TaxID=1756149 RepID=A0A7T7UVK5_9FLAO|nr:formyltransferase family protein [Elizabethkingia bruuniana]AQX83621.1 hypothetical protein AYC65_00665 [Elizabethkingia bruuniana]KUY22264.1 hypothetical protein ATB97_13530 [Elizabethkingia bruuniana]OPB62475.1 hypothetical protein BAY12_11270 [Elizabethkingia bruuniana]QDZ63610.1 hypothetical protein EVD20_14850 [Elizabethkingia bruuniana]QQN57020.1 hypothetical protein I6H88_11155 [Elizabethkingia bruuniana]